MGKIRGIVFFIIIVLFAFLVTFFLGSHHSKVSAITDASLQNSSNTSRAGISVKNTSPDSSPSSSSSSAVNLDIKAKSAVLIDVATGTVLYEQNAHEQLPPASVTKVMTMLLVMEAVDSGKVSLDDPVTISDRAASMGGSQMYMEPGETHTLGEIMEGISMVSANDGCVAAAEYIAGSVEMFVEQMNAKAQELGMKDTHFENTNGLPVANHYTSAYDIAIMSCELMKHEKVKEWFNTWQKTIMVGLPGKQKEFGLTNTNKLIKSYPGANGVKTGFTQDAGYCLSASATRGDLTLVAVIMGAESSKVRFAEASKLLDYGFATYDSAVIANKGGLFGTVPVEKGMKTEVAAVADQNISFLVKKGEKTSITTETALNKSIMAPVSHGQEIGYVRIMQGDKELGKYPLVAAEDIDKVSLPVMYIRMMKSLF